MFQVRDTLYTEETTRKQHIKNNNIKEIVNNYPALTLNNRFSENKEIIYSGKILSKIKTLKKLEIT